MSCLGHYPRSDLKIYGGTVDSLGQWTSGSVLQKDSCDPRNIQLGPGLNVARVPVNGRNFEYLSGGNSSAKSNSWRRDMYNRLAVFENSPLESRFYSERLVNVFLMF